MSVLAYCVTKLFRSTACLVLTLSGPSIFLSTSSPPAMLPPMNLCASVRSCCILLYLWLGLQRKFPALIFKCRPLRAAGNTLFFIWKTNTFLHCNLILKKSSFCFGKKLGSIPLAVGSLGFVDRGGRNIWNLGLTSCFTKFYLLR
jgi:hypothetical protein